MDSELLSVARGEEEALGAQAFGEIIFDDIVSAEVMGVLVACGITHGLHQLGGGITQVEGDGEGAIALDGVFGEVVGGDSGIGFRGHSEEGNRLSKREAALGHTEHFHSLHSGNSHEQASWLCISDVFGGKNNHTPGDEAGLLAGLQHTCHPIDGCVRV